MLSLTLQIKGKDWQVKFITPSQYKKFHPNRDESETALTEPDPRVIWFVKKSIDLRIIRHELMHAHFAECAMHDSNLSRDQLEELSCNLVGEHLDDFLSLTNKIMNFYMQKVLI